MDGNSRIPILELYYCDPDGNGQIELDIEQISQQALNFYGLNPTDPEAILIATSTGDIVKLNNPSANTSLDLICSFGYMLTDIAVDDVGRIYANTFWEINKLDTNGCTFTTIFSNTNFEINSLSFDTGGNMYFGFGNDSAVYRYNADGLTDPYIWHNFETGHAGGDFVMVNGKLYISWYNGVDYRLFEVTVDEAYNYVSHFDKLELPDKTYGLASEFGSLYGITPDWLYKINLDTNTFQSIVYNTENFGQWYGAAGLHEGMSLESTAFLTLSDANNNTSPLPNTYINTQIAQQTIYIRIENVITGEFTVYSVIVHIDNVPQLVRPETIKSCGYNAFDLTTVEDQLLQSVTEDVIVTYHLSLLDAEENSNQLPVIYDSPAQQQTIYVRVSNINNNCYAISDFEIIVYPEPRVAPLVNNISERSLTTCYINNRGNGYFRLEEIYDQLVLDENSSYSLKFYFSYEDAFRGTNSLHKTFYSETHSVFEIFVKVTNQEGCSVISNFFVNGDCVKYSLDTENIYFPKFFTPNNDGFHDFWNVNGISEKLRQESTVSIFDRFGKKLYEFKPFFELGWDGTLKGKPMPSNDYWFILTTPIGRRFSGHFTLKR